MRDFAQILPLLESGGPVSSEREGFRLQRFEALNWGTFHNQVWGLDLGGSNTLLTGDIGSGKSTLVDAIVTLLVPPQKTNYNKAAGAEEKERSARTYVLGQYRKERGEGSLSARPLSLRNQNSYSAILGYFFNEVLGQPVTLAVVFWMKDPQGHPARMYLVADARLSIAEHLAGFGQDIGNLRKRLRGTPSIEIHDSFPGYSSAYRRRFGIENEQAMDLFNQTVSMKSVGNLTDFVREHMLQPFPIEPRIEALIDHFEDLQRAHGAVVKARKQIGLLAPMVADCDERTGLVVQVGGLRSCRDLLHPWFSSRKMALLQVRLTELSAEMQKLAAATRAGVEKRNELKSQRDDAKRDIAQNGGDRIERIEREVVEKQAEKERRERRARQYDEAAAAAGLLAARDSETFLNNRQAIKIALEDLASLQAEQQNGRADAEYELRIRREQHAETQAELESLRRRRSNIPRQMLDLRQRLCSAFGLDEEALPFTGELIQIRPEEQAWEGAIERLLHGFGLSILVSDTDYRRVADWVNNNHLAGRLVYYRVRQQEGIDRGAARRTPILSKVVLKAESPFYSWLEAQFVSRFPHVCCDTLDQFQREPFALTRSGQIKASGERHEKDDRSRIDDRARFILGWSNAPKIAALEQEAKNLETQIQFAADRLTNLQAAIRAFQSRQDALKKLEVFESFPDLDWKPIVIEIERLQREKQELEAGSDVLRLLQTQLAQIEKALEAMQSKLDGLGARSARAAQESERWNLLLEKCQALLTATPQESQTRYFPQIGEMSAKALADKSIAIESIDDREQELRAWLQAAIDAEDKKIARLDQQIVKAMQTYCQEYKHETNEVDINIDAADEYRSMLQSLQSDGLPGFEARFKELLNENTIREVANFQSQLNRERQAIRERIEIINQSLREIDYNPGRYIVLEAETNADIEIRQFQEDLRSCTENALTGSDDEQYSEAKFLQVKGIIERFQGRGNTAELDRRWTRKVTDVRHWFTFSASERWKEDDREFEHYTDSGGKSGGQKEKLAYTVLAASLAYQFGLEWGVSRSRSFRFVVIDEAFGRGSDESTRYGLELFGRLDLQLLVVTPLQKIHVIEPYVSSVGFVHIEDSKTSMLRNLTIEEYRAERAVRRA